MNLEKFELFSCLKCHFVCSSLFLVFLVISMPFSTSAQDGDKTNLASDDTSENNLSDTRSCRELLNAVKDGDRKIVEDLLETVNPNCSYRKEGEPRSPLVYAARKGNLEVAKLLVKANADVEFHAIGDETPLIAAARYGNHDFVKYLLVCGADINTKVVGDGTALLAASRNGHIEIVKYLISQGAEIDGRVMGDGTPLIQAVKHGYFDIVKILLENGADPDLESPGDENPMFHAQELGNKSIIELLKKYGK